ncbi:MAG: arsenate reductase ArsC [Planctomycetota bacterium]
MNLKKKKVLFICTHNSVRSQMAEGLLRSLSGERDEVYSAGTQPSRVHPLAIEVMREINIDISRQRSKNVDEFKGIIFDYVVTVCDQARESCPLFTGAKKYLHQSFEDPFVVRGDSDNIISAFRLVRDEIKNWIDQTFYKE